VGRDAAPILNASSGTLSPPARTQTGVSLGGFQVLQDKVSRARRILENLLAGIGWWHASSSFSGLNIIGALYGSWVPEGRGIGVRRDVVISKGHMAPALYAWFALEGLLDPGDLDGFARPSSPLQSHPDARRLPGLIVASSGSLGQGLSIANGIALASKLDGDRREVAVVLGDGELDEGQVWEAAATSSAKGLDNVIAIVDRNMSQHTGHTERIKPKEPLGDRWRAFGWYTVEAPNDVVAVAVSLASLSRVRGKPKALIVRSR